jgi:hypothetical protein
MKNIGKTTIQSIKANQGVSTTVASIPIPSNTSNTWGEGELKENTSNNNSLSDLLHSSKSSKVLPNNLNVPPTEIKICSEWEGYLPHFEEATKVENLNWSDSHEKAFKELTSLTSKMNLSPNNLDKLSYLLNTEDEFLIKDLFETNRELLFNGGELAKLLLEISVNVPMQDFSTYLTEVNVDLNKMDSSQSWTWIMPSKKICIEDVLKTFPDSQRDFYRNLSSPNFFNELSSNSLMGNKAEIWALLEHFKNENLTLRTRSDPASYSLKNKVSGGSGNQTAPSTPVSYNGNADEIFLKLLASQPKLFNNNFQLLREITRLDEESFDQYFHVFTRSLRSEESLRAMYVILKLKDTNGYCGEISALVKELRNQTPLYEKSAILKKWRNSKDDFEEVISSLIKIKGDSLFDLNDFRLVKSDKASEMFNRRFTNGVINPVDVRWWKSFNQLCAEIKFLDQLEKQWINLSEEEKEVMKSVFIGEKQTLNHFMINDFSETREKLEETLKDICAGAPFDNEYLLGHDWCYSEYSILLEKNNITLKNQLNVINDFSELLTSLIKFRYGSVEDRIKIKCQILNYIYDKNLLVIWLGGAYIYFTAGL